VIPSWDHTLRSFKKVQHQFAEALHTR
jgi:hypothetical protein